jgi:hypothetical protein
MASFNEYKSFVVAKSPSQIASFLDDVDSDVKVEESKTLKSVGSYFGNVECGLQNGKYSKRLRFPLPHGVRIDSLGLGEPDASAVINVDEFTKEVADKWDEFIVGFKDIMIKAEEHFREAIPKSFEIKMQDLRSVRKLKLKLEKIKELRTVTPWEQKDFDRLNEIRSGFAVVEIKCFWTMFNKEKQSYYVGVTFELKQKPLIVDVKSTSLGKRKNDETKEE